MGRKNRAVTQTDFWKTHPKPQTGPNLEFWVMTQTDSWKTRPNRIFLRFFKNDRKSGGDSERFLENSSKQFFFNFLNFYLKLRQKKPLKAIFRGKTINERNLKYIIWTWRSLIGYES